jgi:acetolactate synthase regulatory subunit
MSGSRPSLVYQISLTVSAQRSALMTLQYSKCYNIAIISILGRGLSKLPHGSRSAYRGIA